MRKVGFFLVGALVALMTAAPVAAGPNVTNYSGSAMTAQAGFDSYDEATGTYSWAYVSGWQTDGDPTYVDFYAGSSREIVCTPARPNRPATTSYLSVYRYGFGMGSLSIGRNFSTASVSGTIDVWTETYNGCTDAYTSGSTPGVALEMALTGTGDIIKERGTWSFKIPSQYNSNSRYSSTYRQAAGTATVGSESFDMSGSVGKVSWSGHSNG